MVDSSPYPVSHLRGRGCRFTIVPPAGHEYTLQNGEVKIYTGKNPQGKGWADEGGSNYSEDDPQLQKAISRGWNHGLVGGSGGVVPFDGDDADRLKELGVLQKIPPTVQVESRPGHRHHHLLIPGLQKKTVFYDPILTEEKDGKVQRLHLGEVLGPGGHVVLPGSTHPSGTKYHLVEGCPEEMAEITLDQLKEILRGLEFSPDPDKHVSFEEAAGIKTTRERLEEAVRERKKAKRTDYSSLSDQLDVKRVLDAYSWTPKRTEGDEAKGPAPSHRSESGDCFQVNLRTGRWHCKQCEAGGDLASLVGVLAGIISCTGHDDLRRDGEIFGKILEECEKKGLTEGRPLQKKGSLTEEGEGGENKKRPSSALATVVEIVRGELEKDPEARFCYDQVGQPFLYLDAKGRHIPMAMDSREFGVWAAKTAMDLYNLPLARKTVKEADLSIMAVGEEIMAQKEMDLKVHMSPRVNMIDGSLWYDLGTEDMMGVKVMPQEVAIRPLPLGLVRHPTDHPQVAPDMDADVLEVWKLMDFMPGIQKEDFLFLFPWLVGGFIPCWDPNGGPRVHLPHPLAGFIGPKGSSKTITGRFLLKLLDPDAQEAQNMPDTPRDMGIVLHNNRAVLFDNVTRVQEWQSNALCGGSTGGSNTNRKLRTDSETVIHDYNARTVFTSVIRPEFESDAADRILCFYTRAIPPHMKKPEALLFQEFEKVKPRIMGAIFRTLQKVMKIYPEVLEESKGWETQVRMADFCVIGECCARIWGFEPGLLRDAYSQALIGDSGQMVLDDNVVLALRNWVWTSLILKEGGHWEGLVSRLKEELERDLRYPPKDWPAIPNRFSNRLRKAQEDLARAGISINFRQSKHGTMIAIDATGSNPIEMGGDIDLITTSITTRINAISEAIGGDGGDSCDKNRDNNRRPPQDKSPPKGKGEGLPGGSTQKSGRPEIIPPKTITTTTTITTTEALDSGLGGGDRGGDTPKEGGDHHHQAPKTGKIDRSTPEAEARDPTPEEAELLGTVAERLIKNWPEVSPVQLSKAVHDQGGIFIPGRVVERWLEISGWHKTGARVSGGDGWVPASGVAS